MANDGKSMTSSYLRAVGVGAGVGHGQDAAARVLQIEVFVLKLTTVATALFWEIDAKQNGQ